MTADERLNGLRAQARAIDEARARARVEIARFELLLAEARLAIGVRPGEQIDVFGDGTVKPSSECKSPPGGP